MKLLVERFNAKIKIALGTETIVLKDCDTYTEAYKMLEDYIEAIDEARFDDGKSQFPFDEAYIEKTFVRAED